MSDATPKPTKTLISFDLSQVLNPEDLKKFERAAEEAGAKTLTDHFLNLTLRLPENRKAA